ncbi:MAG: hypothetical protein J6L90_05595 [Clostridia bacterium]|nr:hypothetical protein [Clostridia bacterium]
MSEKKIIVIVISCLLGLLLIFLTPKGTDPIKDAIINTETGDIAYAYYNSQYSVVYLVVYDVEGNRLFSKTLDSGGGGSHVELLYNDDVINVRAERKNIRYSYNRDGSVNYEKRLGDDAYEGHTEFSGWKHSYRKYTFTTDKATYVFREEVFPKYIFNNNCELSIEYPDGTKTVLYYDEAKK